MLIIHVHARQLTSDVKVIEASSSSSAIISVRILTETQGQLIDKWEKLKR